MKENAASAGKDRRRRPRVVIVGGGFGGLNAAKALADVPATITLLDRSNYHLFQPLLYQVATAVLSPADIASPIRHILRRQQNVRVRLGEVERVEPASRRVLLKSGGKESYDYLILAAGATHSYFGHPEWAAVAPGLKTVEDALDIRRRALLAFEEAEWEKDEARRRAMLTFVVVGGGSTGVEIAGALKEVAARAIPREFRFVDTASARIILAEAGSRLLAGMPDKAGSEALRQLREMGVEVRLETPATRIREGEVVLGGERLRARNIVWAAGVRGAPIAETLGVPLDPQGRVIVRGDLSVPGHPEVFVIGDLAHVDDPRLGGLVPGMAPAAVQEGRYVGRILRAEIGGGGGAARSEPYRYWDKGSMATVGRNRAVASFRGRTIGGFPAWIAWSFVHILTLIGFRKRLFVFLSWIWSYFTFTKHARLIVGEGTGAEDVPFPDGGNLSQEVRTMLEFNSILVFSDDPERLTDFYKQVFQKEPDWSEGGFRGFRAGKGFIVFGPHDKVHGKSTVPERVMFNLETSDVKAEFERIKKLGASVVAEPYNPMEDPKGMIATFADPDNNYFQILTPMEEAA